MIGYIYIIKDTLLGNPKTLPSMKVLDKHPFVSVGMVRDTFCMTGLTAIVKAQPKPGAFYQAILFVRQYN
jgi:hypothetical protein